MTILITGTHITPAIATIQAIEDLMPEADVVYVGRKHTGVSVSVEEVELNRVGASFLSIPFGKIHRHPTFQQIQEVFKMPAGFAGAFSILSQLHPRVLVSFGGYASVPLVLAAWIQGVPIIVHEQTSVWGLANRFAKRFAKVKAVSWPHLQEPGVVLTGNPIRAQLLAIKRTVKRPPVLYIIGGNQGSVAIDRVLAPLFPKLLETWEIYHQTQRPFVELDTKRYHAASWFPTPQHAQIMAAASVSVSRAGANSITELLYCGIPSVLIPLPHSAGGEQVKNAEMMASTGLATCIPQNELSPEKLDHTIKIMANSRTDSRVLANARRLVHPDAAVAFSKLITPYLRSS